MSSCLKDIQVYFVNYLFFSFAYFCLRVFIFFLLIYSNLFKDIRDTVPRPCINFSYHAVYYFKLFYAMLC